MIMKKHKKSCREFIGIKKINNNNNRKFLTENEIDLKKENTNFT